MLSREMDTKIKFKCSTCRMHRSPSAEPRSPSAEPNPSVSKKRGSPNGKTLVASPVGGLQAQEKLSDSMAQSNVISP